ncbi:hypothetical protein O0L34_g2346 [Tuta absoluta]|nr:hypothetical protein O0L34_g2346 [Tuta absoluta]
MTQQYSLRWNNHQPNFISMFTSLLNTQTLVDVTLAAEGKHLQAHKVVLSACSNYFQALFMDNPSRHPIVILKDVTFADLRTMVDFMYYGEVHVTEEQLPQVLDTAKTLKIKGLTEMPDSTSVTRSQGTSADFPSAEQQQQQRHLSPVHSPRRRKRRKSSTGSLQMPGGDEGQMDDGGEEARGAADLVRGGDAITLSSVPRRRDYLDQHQAQEAQNMNVEQLGLEANTAGMTQGGQWSVMEHTYGRYSGACGQLQDAGVYVPELDHNVGVGEFPGALGVHAPAGVSPGPSCAPAAQPAAHADPAAAPASAQAPAARRRRATNPQAEENFQRALEAVRFGGIGFCKAARMFGVNNRTLWLEYKKKGYPNTRPSIKSRIKRENSTPPPALKEEPPQQMALVCPPHAMPVGFVDSRPIDFQQGFPHSSPLNLLGVNFNSMQ